MIYVWQIKYFVHELNVLQITEAKRYKLMKIHTYTCVVGVNIYNNYLELPRVATRYSQSSYGLYGAITELTSDQNQIDFSDLFALLH